MAAAKRGRKQWFRVISANPGPSTRNLRCGSAATNLSAPILYERVTMPYLQNLTEPLAHRDPRAVDIWTRLTRFLMLGSECGTYYVQQRALTVENATAVIECLKTDGLRVVRTVVEISTSGRAPKNEPALFALRRRAAPISRAPGPLSQ